MSRVNDWFLLRLAVMVRIHEFMNINLHFWHKIEAHFLEVGILSHDGNSDWVHLVIIEVEVNARWRCAHEIPPVLEIVTVDLLDGKISASGNISAVAGLVRVLFKQRTMFYF